jgi:hypothetical protein
MIFLCSGFRANGTGQQCIRWLVRVAHDIGNTHNVDDVSQSGASGGDLNRFFL